MRKLSCISIVLAITLFLSACGHKTPSSSNTANNTNNTTNKSNSTNNNANKTDNSSSSISNASNANKINYTKEFPYLPTYTADMKLESFTPPEQGRQGFGEAKYSIKNTKQNDILKNYEDILKKDGWAIYEDKKPYSMSAKKDNHVVSLIPGTVGSDALITVVSK